MSSYDGNDRNNRNDKNDRDTLDNKDNMNENHGRGRRKRFWAILVSCSILLVLLAAITYFSGFYRVARFELGDKSTYRIGIRSLAPGISSIAADPQNEAFFEVRVADTSGNPVPAAKIYLEVSGGLGNIACLPGRTTEQGTLLARYSPPDQSTCLKTDSSADITITAAISGTDTKAIAHLKLVRVPVVFIHGYQAKSTLFGNFDEFLKTAGFETNGFDYDSLKGVASGAVQLRTYLDKLTASYAGKGILTSRFNLLAHSMGGLVARYYSCSKEYPEENNISRIIFLSTPQKGSPFASLGLKYYNDQGIHDLVPDNALYTSLFPSMINGGLNNSIRCASILGQYDEVVSADSASLEKWGIRTEVFKVGENNFTVDKLLTGKLAEATNHKLVLDNLKVYQRVEAMLLSDIPYPEKLK